MPIGVFTTRFSFNDLRDIWSSATLARSPKSGRKLTPLAIPPKGESRNRSGSPDRKRGGRIVRFNPRADKWIEYVLPEPYSHNRRTWIDNSTDPVAVWYVDHNGYMVRLQPLD